MKAEAKRNNRIDTLKYLLKGCNLLSANLEFSKNSKYCLCILDSLMNVLKLHELMSHLEDVDIKNLIEGTKLILRGSSECKRYFFDHKGTEDILNMVV